MSQISPAQLTADTDDWAPTGLDTADVVRFSTDASHNLTGMVAPAIGRSLVLLNIGVQPLVLINESGSSAFANQFVLPGAADMTLPGAAGVILVYDLAEAGWYVAGAGTGGGGGGGGNTFGVDFQAFVTTGGATWTKPAGAETVEVIVIGAGAGGGGGAQGTAAIGRFGGNGGGGGGMSRRIFRASDLGTTEDMRVGAGGSGGGSNGNTTNGSNGTKGEASWFGSDRLTPSHAKLWAGGGWGGVGGTNNSTTRLFGGAAGSGNLASNEGQFDVNTTDATLAAIAMVFGSGGASVLNTTSLDYYANGSALYACGGGGAGGSLTASNVATAGGDGGAPVEAQQSFNNQPGIQHGNGGAGGPASGGARNGAVGPTVSYQALYFGGFGGGGGGASLTGGSAPGNGGNGSSYGGGGGGGGAALNSTTTAGSGGAGAQGAVIVITTTAT